MFSIGTNLSQIKETKFLVSTALLHIAYGIPRGSVLRPLLFFSSVICEFSLGAVINVLELSTNDLFKWS